MRQGKFAQDRAPGRRQADPHLALVAGAGVPGDRTAALQTVDEFDRAVMLNEQPRRDFADGRLSLLRQAVHREQQLVLLRLDAVFPGLGFAKVQKPPDLPAKLGQGAILFEREVQSNVHHLYRITIYLVADGMARAPPDENMLRAVAKSGYD